jgi:photosystem II stability/assembly factor-like uncharacterized protein
MTKYVYVGCSARSKTAGPVNAMYRRPIDGESWEMCGLPDNTEVYNVILHPRDPNTLLAATNSGIWRSEDQGKSWTNLQPTEKGEIMFALHFHPNDPSIVYCGTGLVGLYKSTDGGSTWRKMPTPTVKDHFPGAMLTRIMRLAINPKDPDVLYAGMEVNGIMRSDDGGETWVDLNPQFLKFAEDPAMHSMIITKDPSEGLLDVHSISVSEAHPNSVFLACRMGMFRGDQRGTEWVDLDIGRYSEGKVRYGREIIPAPWDAREMYCCASDHARGTHGRVYKSVDGGENWERFDHGITTRAPMIGVGLDATDRNSVHIVTRLQSFSSLDGGRNWREIPMPSEAGSAVTIVVG